MRIFLILLFVSLSYSKTITATYEAKYGWFGRIATAKGVYERNETSYKIIATVKTLGIASSLSGGLVEIYASEGVVKNKRLIPKKYIVTIKRKGNIYVRIYTFDHKNRKVIKKRFKNGVFKKEYTYHYAPDDILTLYWNLPLYLKERKKYTFYAIGGGKKRGRVDISFPSKKETESLKESLFNKNGLFIKANLYNKVFMGDSGVLYLVINPKNWVTLAGMVKNVMKIGDLKGKLVSLKE